MIMPIPAETSQVSVPTLARPWAWAEVGPATATAIAATPMRVRIMVEPPLFEIATRDSARVLSLFVPGENHNQVQMVNYGRQRRCATRRRPSGGERYCGLPQNRWMRRQASASAEVAVA